MTALSLEFRQTCRRLGVSLSPFVLLVDIARQRMKLIPAKPIAECGLRQPQNPWKVYRLWKDHHDSRLDISAPETSALRSFRISTSRFGIGEVAGSNCTPRGLHRIAQKIGGGWPVGAVFRSRKFVGYTWDGIPSAPITNRIFWLEGLEPGRNRGGEVDTFSRYVYIHGTGDEPSLGRPASCGCIHLAAADLIPLHDWLPVGTLVWIE